MLIFNLLIWWKLTVACNPKNWTQGNCFLEGISVRFIWLGENVCVWVYMITCVNTVQLYCLSLCIILPHKSQSYDSYKTQQPPRLLEGSRHSECTCTHDQVEHIDEPHLVISGRTDDFIKTKPLNIEIKEIVGTNFKKNFSEICIY